MLNFASCGLSWSRSIKKIITAKECNKKKYFTELNQPDLQIPTKVKDIPIFEQINMLNLNVCEL